MNPREELQRLRQSYTHQWGDWDDGSPITPDSLVSGAVNQDAELESDGEVWLESSQTWATDEQLENIVKVLREHGNL